MESYGQILFDYLNSDENKVPKEVLYSKLGSQSDKFFVYYIVPLNNFKSIISDNGIKCRNSLENTFTDLSGQNVQSKRESQTFNNKKLTLARKDTRHASLDLDLHDCINFFWNPLNFTFVAFQRKTLINKALSNDKLSNVPCIIEISLEKILNDPNVYWGVSAKNLASDYFTSFSKKLFSSYNWKEILSISKDKATNSFRSAEFVVYRKSNNNNINQSDIIPISYINRIIIKSSDKTIVNSELPKFTNLFACNDLIFDDLNYLLFPDKKFIELIVDKKQIFPLKDLSSFINSFVNLSENKLLVPQIDKFYSTFMAYSFHGVGHTTRVLFWAYLISKLNKLPNDIEYTILIAAIYHDYQREKNTEDNYHGQKSVEKFEKEIRSLIKLKNNQESCLNAIKYHCKVDNECPVEKRDIVWEIIKDADALDRGRFSAPNTKGGCEINYLRNVEVKKYISFFPALAYQIATITRYTSWNQNPLFDLKHQIIACFKTALYHGILSGHYSNDAELFLKDLNVNDK